MDPQPCPKVPLEGVNIILTKKIVDVASENIIILSPCVHKYTGNSDSYELLRDIKKYIVARIYVRRAVFFWVGGGG